MKNRILTEEQIINIAKSNGGEFHVSPRWRDDALRERCYSMKKKGIFKQTSYGVHQSFRLVVDELPQPTGKGKREA